ncbi:MAG: hypothetical protein FJ285_05580 [Planctomycetes bacterium]|nr:hypothetical protein [Planctomycetota bacterium]
MGNPIEHLKGLQERRSSRGTVIPKSTIGAEVRQLRASLERTARRMGSAGDIWERIVPATIRADTRLSGITGGVLHVVTGSASTSYALDRLLREGAETAIRIASEGRITRVRMRVGRVDLEGR